MPGYKVGYLVGSLAAASINRKLARALIRLAPEELEFSEISFRDLPLYSYDYDDDFPPVARAFKAAIVVSDAVLFVTPEYNRSIPGGLKNAIDWASRPYGSHRNPQGLVFGPEGALYSAEHGEKTDDEINLIEAGMNYGWPHILGFQDDQAYVYGNWSAARDCANLDFNAFSFPDAVPQQREADWSAPNFREPLKTLYTVHDGYDFEDPSCGEARFICCPSIGPSSIDFYPEDGAIPGWGNALLVTALKNGAVYVLKLNGASRGIRDADRVLDTVNRYRDLALRPDARAIYVATDSGGIARDAACGGTDQLAHPGAILEFTYTGVPTARAPAQ